MYNSLMFNLISYKKKYISNHALWKAVILRWKTTLWKSFFFFSEDEDDDGDGVPDIDENDDGELWDSRTLFYEKLFFNVKTLGLRRTLVTLMHIICLEIDQIQHYFQSWSTIDFNKNT